MSLIGVDIGSSGVKAVAYDEDGGQLASARAGLRSRSLEPGRLEIDPEQVISAAWDAIARVAANPALRRDPAMALATSACGREAFPVDAGGQPLGPCVRSADQRGGDVAAEIIRLRRADEWIAGCGHLPERMDPIARLAWWRDHEPATFAHARGFWGWHELLTHRLCGRAVVDPSLASHWLAFDLERRGWSPDATNELGIDAGLLPALEAWGSAAGRLGARAGAELGLPDGLLVGVGAFDTTAAAVGAGAAKGGIVGLAVGSWEAGVAPTATRPPTSALLDSALAIGPHPGNVEFGIYLLSPNGAMVLDRVGSWFGQPSGTLDAELASRSVDPSPVLAIPHLAGAGPPWPDGRDRLGALEGLTLATTTADILQAVLEGIACDLALTLDALREAGVEVRVVRATGGGSRSKWWMQLKADLTGCPIEVVEQMEAGALGAAMLAGLSGGRFDSVEDAVRATVRVARTHEPDPSRADRYAEKLEAHRIAGGRG